MSRISNAARRGAGLWVGVALWPATGAQGGFPNVRHVAQGSAEVLIRDGGPTVVEEDATTDESDFEIRFSASDMMGPWTRADAAGASIIALDDDTLRVSVTTEISYSAYSGPAVGGEARAWVDSFLEFTMPASEIWWAYSLGASGVGGFECSFRVQVEDVSLGLTLASFERGSTNEERILAAPKGNVILVHFTTAAAGVAAADDRDSHYCHTGLDVTFTDVDCNGNDVYDPRDIEHGTSEDDNDDGVPDECDGPVIYVNAAAPAGGDGSSWENALTDLQEALELAAQRSPEVSPIWIAKGRYVPTRRTDDTDPRSATFRVDGEIDLYGGFAGHEAELSQRDIEANPTILSGDFNGDDEHDFVHYDENAYHVVMVIGNENSIIFDGLTVTGGHAPDPGYRWSYGGGMLLENAYPDIRNCTFTRNLAERPEGNVAWSGGGGAALFLYQEQQDPGPPPLTVSRSRFTDNSSTGDGAAVFIWGADAAGGVVFSECSFERNVGLGAFSAYEGTTHTFRACSFSDNSSIRSGGAISTYYSGSELLIDQCRFERNSAPYGGAVNWDYGRSVAIHNSVFVDNAAESGVGGSVQIFNTEKVELIDCEFRGNSAGNGGGASLWGNGLTNLRRCRLFENTAKQGFGGGLYVYGSAYLEECTLQKNLAGSGGGLYVEGSVHLHGCTFGSNMAGSGGGLFVDGSAEVTRCTFDGNRATTNGGGIYGSDSDFRYDDDIRLTEVTFSGNEALEDGGGLYDTYSKAHLQNCTFSRNSAIRHGGALFYKVMKGTVTESAFQDNTAHAGGAVYNYGFYDPIFLNCSFMGNTAALGGAVHNYVHGSIYAHCTFTGNSASSYGGAIYNQEVGQEHPLITNDCLFAGNSSTLWGGGVANVFGHATLSDCIFSGNSTGHEGGGLYNYPYNGRVVLLNCTFSQNTAASSGGGVFNANGLSTITNAIVWGNAANDTQSTDAQISTLTNVTYSMIEGLSGPTGTNTGGDPMFVNPDGPDGLLGTADDDVRLQSDSPAINAGDPEFVPVSGETDPDGNPRVLCGRVDMGAYEFWLKGDVDCDRDIDFGDFSEWVACMEGPGAVAPFPDCSAFDFDGDEDVDLADFARFSRVFAPISP